MSRCTSRWLPVAALSVGAENVFIFALPVLLCLLAASSAQGADGAAARDVSIPGTGLSLRVPPGVAVSPGISASPGVATLFLEVEPIRSFSRNGVISKADVLAQRAALAKGRAKVADGWSEDGLDEIVSLPTGGFAVIYPQYSEFEICDLRFTMNAAFFVGDQRVILRYSLPPAAIIAQDPVFFSHDVAGCEADTIWKDPGPDLFKRFHEAVKAGRLGTAANAWYADFTTILASLHRKIPSR
ncbi:MAG: hypothetical protein HQK81_04100 [Desulfovibrionaceae bacterium]|nr:hypothetical protein [Desulfovibrionaceae bacterium]MBF0513226.1 hypothetical protein [Desulfovibrionaceae bacterium]